MENQENTPKKDQIPEEIIVLSPKRERFCQEYIIDLNGKQAAIRSGYSEKSAEVTASRLLSDVKVKARIAQLMAERAKRCEVKQDDVIAELKRLGFSDMRNLAEWNSVLVKLKDSSEISDSDAACVESVSQTVSKDGGSLSIKLHSKTKALELLTRHLGMLHDKIDHTTKGKELAQPPVFQIIDDKTKAQCEQLIAGGGRESEAPLTAAPPDGK
jgi:phage terminase small subunit